MSERGKYPTLGTHPIWAGYVEDVRKINNWPSSVDGKQSQPDFQALQELRRRMARSEYLIGNDVGVTVADVYSAAYQSVSGEFS